LNESWLWQLKVAFWNGSATGSENPDTFCPSGFVNSEALVKRGTTFGRKKPFFQFCVEN